VAAALLVAYALSLGLHAALGAPLPLLAPGVPWSEASFLALLAGLALAGAGGLGAALAGAVPGRELEARWARRLALVGTALAALGAVAWLARTEPWLPLASSLRCTAHATALGVAPFAVVGFFLVRAWGRRPYRLAAWASLGTLALGAVVVHASCTLGGALHVVLGHMAAPLCTALLLALPLGLLLGRAWRST
jgi:hypothetical protein